MSLWDSELHVTDRALSTGHVLIFFEIVQPYDLTVTEARNRGA